MYNFPEAGTTAENHTSPSPLPSHNVAGTVELVAPVLFDTVALQEVPTVRTVAEQGSSFAIPGALQGVRQEEVLILLRMSASGCGPNPRARFIPFPPERCQ